MDYSDLWCVCGDAILDGGSATPAARLLDMLVSTQLSNDETQPA